MRGWGLLLGGATSLAKLAGAVAVQDLGGVILAVAAIPGLMLVLPVLAALRGSRGAASPGGATHVRVAEDAASAVRVAPLSLDSEPDVADVAAGEARPALRA
jgi:hypothetical protein